MCSFRRVPRVKRLPSQHAFPGPVSPVVDRREDEIYADSDEKKVEWRLHDHSGWIGRRVVGEESESGTQGERKGCLKQQHLQPESVL